MKHKLVFLFILCMIVPAAWGLYLNAEPSASISISGLVRQPLTLTLNDLSAFQALTLRQNEITPGKEFHGAFNYRGVPLKSLLDLCTVSKEESGFSKLIDLVIIVKNREGKRSVLSWAEVAYRNPADVIIATGGEPVMPMKKCSDCHKSEAEYKRWHDPLVRAIGYPRLVIAGDFYSGRCLEGVCAIEVVNGTPGKPAKKTQPKNSPSLSILTQGGKSHTLKEIDKYPVITMPAKQIGDGKGFHGLKEYSGASLLDILVKNNITVDADSVLVATAADGYRSVISGGELLYSSAGKGIIVADRLDGRPIKEYGKFHLVFPMDLSADRWVKSLEKIEIVKPAGKARLSIIGVGCGDTSLITLEAVSAMSAADVFICTEDIKNRFAKYMGGKPVLYDPLLSLPHYYSKMNPGVPMDEVKRRVEKLRADNITLIKDALKSGKTVAFLEYGDPTIYGSWTYWLYEHFSREEVRVVPGVSSFNAANAMIGTNVARSGSVIITVPDGIKNNEAMVQAAAKHGDTLAVFIALNEVKNLMPVFRKYYADTTPVFVVYKAGYSNDGQIIRSTMKEFPGVVEREKEKFLGLIYIGADLK